MTTYQEPQPVSRRAARQHERGESQAAVPSDAASLTGQFAPPPLVEPGQAVYPTPSDNLWDTLSRRAAQLPLTTPEPRSTVAETQAPPPPGGRRAASHQPRNRSEPEPLNSATVGGIPSLFVPPSQFAPPEQPAPTVYSDRQASDYRARDFSPQSRRSLREAADVPSAPQFAPTQEFSQFAPSAPVHAPVILPAAPISQHGLVEHTLSRRELRALENAQQTPSPEAMWPAPFAPPMPQVPAPQVHALQVHAPQVQAPQVPAPQVHAPVDQAPVVHAPSEPAPWTAPVGHWSHQLDASADRFADIESTINRTVGGASASTSALVLPEIPRGSDIRGVLTHAGEVMLTGSINLPLSLSSTGTTERIDQGGIDDLFDWRDEEVVSLDSQPVRAVTAVSTSVGGRGVTHTQKPKGTRGLTALLVTACALAVVVTGLIIAAFAFNML